ncbi:hypothetical protein R80B4_01451 [Fibrobacteres bacterium R8-0-B4]
MNRKRIIYLDTCIYGRRFDAPPNARTRAEAAAVKAILKKCKTGGHKIIGSAAVASEIGQIPNAAARADIDAFYKKTVDEEFPLTAEAVKRALYFEAHGLGEMDAMHLAAAESAGADFLLTVDADFIRKCNNTNLTAVTVMNPINFVKGGYLK